MYNHGIDSQLKKRLSVKRTSRLLPPFGGFFYIVAGIKNGYICEIMVYLYVITT